MNSTEILIAARWRAEVLEWFDTWEGRPQLMPSGRHRSAARLLRACVGLAQLARADGRLKGAHADYWTTQQLAETMGCSKRIGIDILVWLEQSGRLVRTRGALTTEGREPDMRRLILPQPTVTGLSSDMHQGAMVTESPSHGDRNGTPWLPPTLEPGLPPELEPVTSPLKALLSQSPLVIGDVGKPTQTDELVTAWCQQTGRPASSRDLAELKNWELEFGFRVSVGDMVTTLSEVWQRAVTGGVTPEHPGYFRREIRELFERTPHGRSDNGATPTKPHVEAVGIGEPPPWRKS